MTASLAVTREAGVAIIAIDLADRSTNVITRDLVIDLADAVAAAVADETVVGLVITSAKPGFLVGADLSLMAEFAAVRTDETPAERGDRLRRELDGFGTLLRRLETCGKPVVAAIGGTALGGGLELCLACHVRLLADDPAIRLGLPEVTLGLMPGAGGTQRLPRLIGAAAALPLLLEGRAIKPEEALKLGIVDRVLPPDQLVEAATAMVRTGGPVDQPWDRKGFRLPGGAVYGPGAQVFIGGNALVHAKSYGRYPAPRAILQAVYEGLQLPFDRALGVEARQMIGLLMEPTARHMVRTLFLDKRRADRPTVKPRTPLTSIGVLGAGMMGAGIAQVAAEAGLRVVLLDRTIELAERGREHGARLLQKRVGKGDLTPGQAAAISARIAATTDFGDLADADLVVEAVFEDRASKAAVIAAAEAVLGPAAIFGSNTSTLPISGLAAASQRPERFIGIHFFSPVERMPLVEIIRGRRTGDEALAVALDFVHRLGKTPIVVNDGRGFYTSRVFGTYTGEGVMMLAEGIAPALIENAGRMSGMPMPPLSLSDEVALDLMDRVLKQTQRDLGDRYQPTALDHVIAAMVSDHERLGKKAGRGFYDYPQDAPKRLWPELRELFPPLADQPSVELLQRRLLHIQALEAARCLEEGTVADAADADLGAVLGWGFAPWTGGPLSYIDRVGVRRFVDECEGLTETVGPRFAPNDLLRDLASSGGSVRSEIDLARG